MLVQVITNVILATSSRQVYQTNDILWKLFSSQCIPATPPSKGSNPIDFGNASCNPVIIGSSVAI